MNSCFYGDEVMTAQQIEAFYKNSLCAPFPYRDCFWLAKESQISSEDIIPELDWYFGSVAGYASSATRLADRPDEALQTASSFLSKSFLQHFPELEPCLPFIDELRTPVLLQHLAAVEEARAALLLLLSKLKRQ